MESMTAMAAIRKEALRVEETYHNVFFARSYPEYDYGKLFHSDLRRDEEEVAAVYRRIVEFLETIDSQTSSIRGQKALLYARLSKITSSYERKLEKIDQAINELESGYIAGEYLYEYVDLSFWKGTYLVEQRARISDVEEVYRKAERMILEYGSADTRPQPLFEASEAWDAANAAGILPDWNHMLCRFYTSVASFRLDAYDRTTDWEKKRPQLEEAHRYLCKAELLLPTDGTAEKDGTSFRIANLTKTGRELWFAPRSMRFDPHKVVNLTYLSTRAFYHLKKSRESCPQSFDEVLNALELYMAGFLYDLRNTISMDNVAYICYQFGDEKKNSKDERKDARDRGETPPALSETFWEALKERDSIRILYEKFPDRLKQELKSRLVFESVSCMFGQIYQKIQRDISDEINEKLDDVFLSSSHGKWGARLPASLIRKIWTGIGQNIQGLGQIALNWTANESALWNGLFDRRAEDGMEPRPLLPPGVRPVDQMVEERRDAIEQDVEGILRRRWHRSGRLIKLRGPGEAGEAFADSGYSLCLQGPAETEMRAWIRPAEERDREGMWRIFFQPEASAALDGAFREIMGKVCALNGAASGSTEVSHAYDLLDWIYTVIRKGKTDNKVGTIHDTVGSFLTEVLRCDASNMYALNLMTLNEKRLEDRMEKADEVDRIYTILRLSTLKRRFNDLDRLAALTREGKRAVDQRQRIKLEIIKLYNRVSEFMSDYLEKFDGGQNDVEVGHYTRMKVLKALIHEKAPHQRMYNVQHMNDPREGKIFIDLLRRYNEKHDRSGRNFSDKLIEAYSDDSRKSSAYIGSFTASLDCLSMWSKYGEDGRGCCMTIDGSQTFSSSDYIDMSALYISDKADARRFLDNRYALYRVIYYPDVGNYDRDLFGNLKKLDNELSKLDATEELDKLESLWRKINRLLGDLREERKAICPYEPERGGCPGTACRSAKLGDCIRRLGEIAKRKGGEPGDPAELKEIFEQVNSICGNDKLDEMVQKAMECFDSIDRELEQICRDKEDGQRFYDEVINIVMIIVDQVRFLIKSEYYSYEREYRVIRHSSDVCCDPDRDAVPQLYFEMKSPIHYKRVCLGPKVPNYESVAAYITNKHWKEGGDIKVTRSQIAYRD